MPDAAASPLQNDAPAVPKAELIAALQQDPECNSIVLEKNFGQTEIVGQGMLDEPAWHWPD